MNYHGLIACALLLAIACFHIGRRYERISARRYSEAADRIRQKYRAHKDATERV